MKRIGHKKCRPKAAGFFELLVLALLIGHAAAGLAGGLARGLALAAAAVLGALAHVAGLKGLDSLHNRYLQFSNRFDLCRHAYCSETV